MDDMPVCRINGCGSGVDLLSTSLVPRDRATRRCHDSSGSAPDDGGLNGSAILWLRVLVLGLGTPWLHMRNAPPENSRGRAGSQRHTRPVYRFE
jgi:hypothetical protein